MTTKLAQPLTQWETRALSERNGDFEIVIECWNVLMGENGVKLFRKVDSSQFLEFSTVISMANDRQDTPRRIRPERVRSVPLLRFLGPHVEPHELSDLGQFQSSVQNTPLDRSHLLRSRNVHPSVSFRSTPNSSKSDENWQSYGTLPILNTSRIPDLR